jgi:uncharacterized surface protein with fasciclin (FAS1) repeats
MKNIYDTLRENGNFNTLIGAIDTAGMEDDFKTGGEFTLFAPSDKAFSDVSKKQTDSLLRDKKSAGELVRRHTMNGRSLSKGLRNSITALNGESTKVDRSEGLRIGEAMAVQPDIECDNGVVHVIDKVLIPQSTMIKA